jgi:hypothetical protein
MSNFLVEETDKESFALTCSLQQAKRIVQALIKTEFPNAIIGKNMLETPSNYRKKRGTSDLYLVYLATVEFYSGKLRTYSISEFDQSVEVKK